MKTRIIVGVGLLATLLAVPVIGEAQPNQDTERLQQLTELLSRLRTESLALDNQRGNSIREISAREEALKAELLQLSQKRTELERSLDQRRQELHERIDKTTGEIHALTSAPKQVRAPKAPYKPSKAPDTLEEKVDQILKRLEVMEQRLNRLDWKVNPPPK
jgi:DNA repair exonuclease SbcCD ATPase subunit